jgi:putative MATE family efflux protein
MIGTFVQSIIMITDSAFISNLGTHQYDAVGNAGVLYISLIMLIQGIADTGQIIIARRNGEKKFGEVGRTFRHSIVILFSVSIILFIIYALFTSPFLISTVSDLKIGNFMNEFIGTRKYGVLAEAFRLGIIAFYIGIGKTNVIIYSTLILAFGNIFLDYCFIFGNYGFPELGVQGAALASVFAEIMSLVFLIIFLFIQNRKNNYNLFERFKFDQGIVKKFLNLSPPLMIQGFIALAAWYLFFSMIESMGAQKLEISHVIRNLYFIAFIPLYGFGATTKTFVSSLIGANQIKLIKPFLKRVILLNFIFLIILMHGIVFYPDLIINLINKNDALIADPIIYNEIKSIFLLVSGSMLLFGGIAPFFNAVSGTGNTKASMLIEITSIAIYLIASFLIIYILKADLYSVWSVEYIYFGALGLFSIIYLKFANWKKTEI